MNNLQVFQNNEFGEIRTVLVEDKPYFVGVDIARSLGYSNPSKAIIQHCKGVTKMGIPSKGGVQETNIIPEGDIYRLITKSELPTAEKFETWVFDEVLPTIRKHGAYMTPEVIEKTLTDPDFIIGLATQLKEEQQKRLQAEKQITLQRREIEHKTEVIKGVTDDIDIYTKRNVLNKVVKFQGANFSERWNELYNRYREVCSVDLKARCEGHNLKQKKKKDQLSVIKYAEKFGHIDNLYKVALKLYKTDINEILQHLQEIA